MRLQGRLFLYFLAGAAIVTVLSIGIFLAIAPEAAGSADTSELTSPGGRIRVDQVLSYVDPRRVRGIGHDFETEAPAAVYVPFVSSGGLSSFSNAADDQNVCRTALRR